MAITKLVSTETFGEMLNRMNDNICKMVTAVNYSDPTLTLTLFDGTTLTTNINSSNPVTDINLNSGELVLTLADGSTVSDNFALKDYFQIKDTDAIVNNVAIFDASGNTIDSGFNIYEIIKTGDTAPANTIFSNPTSGIDNRTDFAVQTQSVVGRFLGNIDNLDVVDINDTAHSTTRNEVNDLLHWTMGTRFRHWGDITVPSSTISYLLFDNLVNNKWFSGSGASPNDTTDYFFPAGSLKEGMNVKIRMHVEATISTNTVKLEFNGTSITPTIAIGDSLGAQDYFVEIDMIVTSVDDTTGSILTSVKTVNDFNDNEVVHQDTSNLDTVNDAYIDLDVFTDTDSVTFKYIEIIIAG